MGSQEHFAARPDCASSFAVEHGGMVLLHGFIKKTQKTPQREIEFGAQTKKGKHA
jgi:hypothetical protein